MIKSIYFISIEDFNQCGCYLTQETVDDVETLFKRHEDFENTLVVQDEKLKDLDEMANKRIAEKHPDKDQ